MSGLAGLVDASAMTVLPMNELAGLDGATMTVLRVLAWSNVGVAVAFLVAVATWLLCCGIESGRPAENGAR